LSGPARRPHHRFWAHAPFSRRNQAPAITSGQVIVSAAAGDVITVRNHSSAAAVTLQSLAGGTLANVNASITLQKLS
jgi:hypothetical protein